MRDVARHRMIVGMKDDRLTRSWAKLARMLQLFALLNVLIF
jgi:hypothetical protein